jgi:hypothetical protein
MYANKKEIHRKAVLNVQPVRLLNSISLPSLWQEIKTTQKSPVNEDNYVWNNKVAYYR